MSKKSVLAVNMLPARKRGHAKPSGKKQGGQEMVKRFAMYTIIPEGADADEVWNYHSKIHAPAFVELAGPGLLKYVLNRVTEVVSGKPKFSVLAEMWWENEAIMNQTIEKARVTKSPRGRTIKGDLKSSEGKDEFITLVEECVIKE